jgi:hypothetical protein
MKAPTLTTDYVNSEAFSKKLAQQIRDAAAFDVDALVASGDLTKKAGGWYVLRDHTVLDKVHHMVKAMENRKVRGQQELRVQFESVTAYKKLAAKLKPGL